jgi:cytochrome c oxidase subunit 2
MWSGVPLFPEQASTFASRVDNLYLFMVGLTAFISLLIAILVAFFGVKYRDRTDTGAGVGAPITGSIPLELIWSISPFGVSVVIFVWAASVFFDYVRPPDQTLQIYSTGKRWMWRFQHINGHSEINELHVPLGRAVKITFTSEDVLHSLFIPAFRIKADAIPGRYSTIWFTPTRAGEYHLFCAEYCGTQHSGMIGRVVVLEPAAYQTWLGGARPEEPMAARGERLFSDLACDTCHLPNGSGRGPSLRNTFGTSRMLANGRTAIVDESYLRESILNPQAKIVAGYQPLMPTFQGLVSEENVMALVEYVKSLSAPERSEQSAGGEEPGTPARRGAPASLHRGEDEVPQPVGSAGLESEGAPRHAAATEERSQAEPR